jgi:hypothetical protein
MVQPPHDLLGFLLRRLLGYALVLVLIACSLWLMTTFIEVIGG